MKKIILIITSLVFFYGVSHANTLTAESVTQSICTDHGVDEISKECTDRLLKAMSSATSKQEIFAIKNAVVEIVEYKKKQFLENLEAKSNIYYEQLFKIYNVLSNVQVKK